jgi:glutamate/tyrosine decarboxylase-like PLP-dependent enzyme
MRFELDSDMRRQLGHELIDIIDRYYESLPTLPVQLPAEQRSFTPLDGKMPENAADPVHVLKELAQGLIDYGFHVPSANYFGLMNPTPTYTAVLAEALVAALNPQLATQNRAQLASKIENETVRWIAERVGWPDAPGSIGGTFTSGGNEANFSGIALALAQQFPQYVNDGVHSIGAQPVLYASSESHHSLDKSAGLLGLGRSALRRIPVNDEAQLDPSALNAAILSDKKAGDKPFCVVATVGTTNSGAIDNLTHLSYICKEHELWLHVDGAYGAAAIFSDRFREIVHGIEQADSITVDPHKWLAMPFSAGVILTNKAHLLEQAFGVHTPYMPQGGAPMPDNFKVSTQWSRRMNSLKVYLTLRVHGRLAYENHIGRQMDLARQFVGRMTGWDEAQFDLAIPQVLPIINLRVKMPSEDAVEAANQAIVEEVTSSGERWISATQVNGRSVIRIMIISYLTTANHLEQLAQAMDSAAQKVRTRRAQAT